jgi:hypothetical protein
MADKLADAYWSLSPADRAKAGILVDNYGEASAVNVYRPDAFGQKREALELQFTSVTEVSQ